MTRQIRKARSTSEPGTTAAVPPHAPAPPLVVDPVRAAPGGDRL